MAPFCKPTKKVTSKVEEEGDAYKFVRIFHDPQFCTYVCKYDQTIAASHAIVSCRVNEVGDLKDLSEAAINLIPEY